MADIACDQKADPTLQKFYSGIFEPHGVRVIGKTKLLMYNTKQSFSSLIPSNENHSIISYLSTAPKIHTHERYN